MKLLVYLLIIFLSSSQAVAMPHNRRCDIAQDSPGDLNGGQGNAIMFGPCAKIDDMPPGEFVSRHHLWNAFNCGYQAYRESKSFKANPYRHDELKGRWREGWKAAEDACRSGKGPFD